MRKTIKSLGIADVQVREAICQEYFFDSGHFLDSGWFKSGDKTLWPELGFAERPLDPEQGLGEIHTLYLADYFSFHEYAHGDIHWYFQEHSEDAGEIENGCV